MCCLYFCEIMDLSKFNWSLICFCIAFSCSQIDYIDATGNDRLTLPTSYTSLSGDLHVNLLLDDLSSLASFKDLKLKVSSIQDRNEEEENENIFNIYPNPRNNVTEITVPCETFSTGGGLYDVGIVRNVSGSLVDIEEDGLKKELDVRWPNPKLSVMSEQIGTYPEKSVDVLLTFPEIQCEVENTAESPEFWLELIFCGQDSIMCPVNSSGTGSHVLYAEQVRGLPKTKLIRLRCELFGLAGLYAVQFRPVQPTPSFVSATSYIRVDWSEKFVFNVHTRSIFPCDPHSGVRVLFEYPACILDQADRVRLYAKLRADVASLKPPTSLHYITEQRVKRGQHFLNFDCDYFSEKYVEYCFVYVSQALSGAVADIRMDCVPTLPLSEFDTGGWGPWSEWTPCSTTCSGGTRSRYRLCDSPPPRYGAKFCEGEAVQTEHCGKESPDSWECIYRLSGKNVTPPENSQKMPMDIGYECRCGCMIHLGTSRPKIKLASSAQSCPGRSFWLIQADHYNQIGMVFEFFQLTCPTQYIKVRDGDSLASNLLAEYVGGIKLFSTKITSTKSQILIEFYSEEIASLDGSCSGAFLAFAEQIVGSVNPKNSTSMISRAIIQRRPQPIKKELTVAHVAVAIFASIIMIISALLGTQYILRYRKYHLTVNTSDQESPYQTPHNPSRAASTITLFSEVIYLVKIRSKERMKHTLLRESVDVEALEKDTTFQNEIKIQQEGESYDSGSSHTLTNDVLNEKDDNHHYDKEVISSRNSQDGDDESMKSSLERKLSNTSSLSDNKDATTIGRDMIKLKCCSGLEKNKKEKDDEALKNNFTRRKFSLSVNNVTLTNGSYSPASGSINTATIRTTTQKESKEKLNRERLLSRPDSEFSLANPEDFELDYYDYNVVNAGAAPGSYLGMDPAFLVWIPPLDVDNIIHEAATNPEPHYEEILTNLNGLDPKSNTETPDSDILELPSLHICKKKSSQEAENLKNFVINQQATTIFNEKISSIPYSNKSSVEDNLQNKFCDSKLNRLSHLTNTSNDESESSEKETSVVKSCSDLQDYYELDDIKFADEEDQQNEVISTKSTLKLNITKRYVKS